MNKLTNLEDVRFVIYEQLKVEELCQFERFQDHSMATFDLVISTAEKLAVNYFASRNQEGDKIGCTLENRKVLVPGTFHEALKKYCEGGGL